jgi:hypothetical protein
MSLGTAEAAFVWDLLFDKLVSISPTFYEQLLHQNPFAKKISNPNCKHIKAAQKNFV